ncbi:RILP-like protein homolog isoform X1 [Daphnia magna]|uniref:RILP protein n=2 Tax=Daphnia magna TaxID=35525 RepID=A0A0P5G867_9CRUS|nr:RILP-like protein homolog isoform X1 [Daphnia magna]XP_045032817.1 RILP-like protein homolog isoform X1 [Daphnia magna]KZS13919.1 RILP protein [Daphnia magna]
MPLPTARCVEDQQDSSSEYDSLPDISVVDVFDLASDVGNELEKIINIHGNELVQGLMQKVIRVLELLDKTSKRQESERQLVEELQSNISLLEREKREKAVDRLRYEREIEQLEENWKKETQELLGKITRVQEENKRLSSSLKESKEKIVSKKPVLKEPDWDIFEKLREANEKQRDLLRCRDKEYQDKVAENESLQNQVERLTEINKELRRKQSHMSQQMRTLVEERADLQALHQEQSRNLTALQKRLGVAQRDNEDLIQCQNDVPDLTNKIVIDINDPNRPRFTIAELKEILCERNELKARNSDLVDELALYRPSKNHSNPERVSPTNGGSIVSSADLLVSETDESSTDLPVQGPLPYEPDDAPWKRPTSRRKESSIRKLFSTLSSFPRLLAPRTVDGAK